MKGKTAPTGSRLQISEQALELRTNGSIEAALYDSVKKRIYLLASVEAFVGFVSFIQFRPDEITRSQDNATV